MSQVSPAETRASACIHLLHMLLQRLETKQPGLVQDMLDGAKADQASFNIQEKKPESASRIFDEAISIRQSSCAALRTVSLGVGRQCNFNMRQMFLCTVLLVISACASKQQFSAEYKAPLSEVSASVSSAVLVRNGETLERNRGFARIYIRPEGQQTGERFQLAAELHENGETWLQDGLENKRRSWSDPAALLQILHRHGYMKLDENEMKRLNHALFNSLSSSHGFVMMG